MHRPPIRSTLTRLTALCVLAPGTALADVTPDEVWQNVGAALSGLGGIVTADLSSAGDTLTAADIRVTFDLPMDAGEVAVRYGTVTFTDNGDGTVRLGGPETQDFRISADIDGEGGVTLLGSYSIEDYQTIASGDPGNVTYSYEIGRYVIAFDKIEMRGKAAEQGDVTLDGQMDLIGLSGDYSFQEGALFRTRSGGRIEAGQFDFTYVIDEPGSDPLTVRSTSTLGTMTASADIRIPTEGVNLMALGDAFRAGLLADYTYAMDGQTSDQTTSLGGRVLTQQISRIARSEGTMIIGKDGLRLTGTAEGYDLGLYQPDLLPILISLTMDRVDGNIAFPFLKTDSPQAMTLDGEVAGLVLGNPIWGMIDPEGRLPHDPARLRVDLTGTMKWLVDLVDFEALASSDGADAAPVELHGLTINEITLNAAGVEAGMTGAFTVDNDDMQTFMPGTPTPDGRAEIRVSGLLGLIDTLIGMGLMSEPDAMGPRMVLNGFARKVGEDSYRSEIVVDGETGQVSAGGQRLK